MNDYSLLFMWNINEHGLELDRPRQGSTGAGEVGSHDIGGDIYGTF